MAALNPRQVPSTRALPRELRAARLLAARRYRPGTIPRIAILLGHWDGGRQVPTTTKGHSDGNQS